MFHFKSEAHATAALYDAALLLLEATPYLKYSMSETGKLRLRQLCNDIADNRRVLESASAASDGFISLPLERR